MILYFTGRWENRQILVDIALLLLLPVIDLLPLYYFCPLLFHSPKNPLTRTRLPPCVTCTVTAPHSFV